MTPVDRDHLPPDRGFKLRYGCPATIATHASQG